MHSESLLTTIQHINWIKLIHNSHVRHYLWEISKILIPAMLTGLITFIAMRIADNRNKKRWLNDGHLKRKIELEIEIRKFLLGIKAHASRSYEVLADWAENQDSVAPTLIYEFNASFESLVEYLKNEENEDTHYNKIFALMDEYVCYVPKINDLFSDFKMFYEKIFSLKTINESGVDPLVLEEVKKRPEHFNNMINAYLCFQVVIDRILKKMNVSKIK